MEERTMNDDFDDDFNSADDGDTEDLAMAMDHADEPEIDDQDDDDADDDGGLAGPAIRRTTRECSCVLTEQEKVGLGAVLAAKEGERENVLAAKRAANADYNERLKELAKVITETSRSIREGTTMRDVECEERRDVAAREIRVIRLDTGELAEPVRVLGFDAVKDEGKSTGKKTREQGSLFGGAEAAPPPVVYVAAVTLDGELVRLTAEQADAARSILDRGATKTTPIVMHLGEPEERTVNIAKVLGAAPAPVVDLAERRAQRADQAGEPEPKKLRLFGTDSAGREFDLTLDQAREFRAAIAAGEPYHVTVSGADDVDEEEVELITLEGDVDEMNALEAMDGVTMVNAAAAFSAGDADLAQPPPVAPDASKLELKLLEDIAACATQADLGAWAVRSIGARATLKPGPKSRVGKTARARFHALGGQGRFSLPSKLAAATTTEAVQ